MTPSTRARSLVQQFEGCPLHSYQDSGGKWTIGWGHTSEVTKGQDITQAQADQFLDDDLIDVGKMIEPMIKVALTQDQFDALCSFAYNVGVGNFFHSTLRKRINACKFKEAGEEFLLWNKSGSKVLPGLVRRRAAERALFLSLPGEKEEV